MAEARLENRDAIGAFLLCLAAIAAAGAALVAVSTSRRTGFQPDSTAYVSAAQNLAAGRGLTETPSGAAVPMTHFGPGYSVLLAIPIWLGMGWESAARMLGILCMILNVGLLGVIGWRNVPVRWLGLAAALAGATALCYIEDHSIAMSEAPFLVFFTASLGALLESQRKGRFRWMAASAALMAVAVSIRFAALPFPCVFALALWLRPLARRRRWTDSLVYLAGSFSLFGAWVLHNELSAGTAVHRPVARHFLSAGDWIGGLWEGFSTWALPGSVPSIIRLAALVALAAVIGVALARRRRGPAAPARESSAQGWMEALCGGAILAYLCFLYLSISLVDRMTPLDSRILSPAFPLLALLLTSLAARLWQASRRGDRIALLALAGLGGLLAIGCARGVRQAFYFRAHGVRYNVVQIEKGRLISVARRLPPETTVYSNRSDFVFFLVDRPCRRLPNQFSPYSGLENPDYKAELESLRQMVTGGKAVLLLFFFEGKPGLWPHQMAPEALKSLPLGERDEGGEIYAAPGLLARLE